jgi:hypothetical protein
MYLINQQSAALIQRPPWSHPISRTPRTLRILGEIATVTVEAFAVAEVVLFWLAALPIAALFRVVLAVSDKIQGLPKRRCVV